MPTTTTRTTALRHPVRFLVLCFCAWKLLLLLVALASPGHGYDTSTSLLLAGGHGIQLGHQSLRDDGLPDDLAERLREQLGLTKHPMNHTLNHNTNHNPNPLRSALGLLQPSGSLSHPEQQPLPPALHLLALKLTRWDAIYYVQAAARGYRYEQEWAFGWGFNRLIAAGAALAHTAGVPPYRGLESLVAVALAHTAHLLAVLVLFALTKSLFPRAPAALPLTAALLHLLSPAGLFLSAPYAESACALLSFAGCWFFAQSRVPVGPSHASSSSSSSSFSLRSDLLLVAAGVAFGMATTLRSNGILNGLLLLEEAFRTLHSLLLTRDVRWVSTRHLLATGFGGVCVAAGLLLPQSLAYMEFCAPSPSRPWCMRTLPSIYTFVQEHYWYVPPLLRRALLFLTGPGTSDCFGTGPWAMCHCSSSPHRCWS